MTEDQIKHMVNRFLGWKLPRDTFNPDCGISFDKKPFNTHTAHPMKYEPSGTNLFDATQADAMVRYIISDLPARSDRWQPIETAPRDGTPFLCFHPDDVFSSQTGIDLIWYEPSIKTYTMDGDNEVPFAGITHWRPLPNPPAVADTRRTDVAESTPRDGFTDQQAPS